MSKLDHSGRISRRTNNDDIVITFQLMLLKRRYKTRLLRTSQKSPFASLVMPHENNN